MLSGPIQNDDPVQEVAAHLLSLETADTMEPELE